MSDQPEYEPAEDKPAQDSPSEDLSAEKEENRLEILETKYKKLCSKFKQRPLKRILAQLQDAIQNNQSRLEYINLNSSGFTDDTKIYDRDIVPFLECVKNNDSQDLVLRLDLSWNRMSDLGAKCLSEYVKENKYLIELNIQGNDITKTGGVKLCQALLNACEKDWCNIEKLNLNGNSLGDDTIILLSEFLSKTKKLKELDIGNCDFTHKAWMHIMINLQSNKSLNALNIENCRIITLSHEMSVVLAKLLQYNKNLESLNLARQGDGIGDEGMEWLSEYLCANASIKTLDLSCNRISSDGMENLAQVLSQSECIIENLSLQGNRLTDLSAKYVCQIIEQSKSIKYINLKQCSFTNDGLYLIAQTLNEMIDNNHSNIIHTILLDDNEFGNESSQLWKEVIAKLQTFEQEKDDCQFIFDFWPLIQQ